MGNQLHSNDPFNGRRTRGQNTAETRVYQRDPTTADNNSNVGAFWINALDKKAFIMIGKNAGVATWGKLAGSYDYQESVLKQTNFAGAVATEGNRYLSTATSGSWTADYIYEYQGAAWEGTAPSEGMVVFDEETAGYLLYASAAWGSFTTGITTIAAATDTNITTPSGAQLLIWDNSNSWDNKDLTGDVAITTGGVSTVTDLTFGSDAQGDITIRGAANWERVSFKTDKYIGIGNGTTFNSVLWSGDVALSNAGVSTVTDFTLASEAEGTIAQFDGSNWVVLGVGSAGQALVSGGAAAVNFWGTPSVSSATSIANGATLNDAGTDDAILAFTTQTVSAPTLTIPDFASVSDTFVFKTKAETLANKTLTSPDINSGTADSLTGFSIRSSGAAFDLEQDTAEVLTGNKIISWDVGDTNRSITLGGNIALGGTLTTLAAWSQTGAHTIGVTTTGATTVTLPTTGTLATLAGSEALSNKTLTAPGITGGTAIELTAFSIRSTGAAFDLLQATSEVLSGDKTISWDVGDTNRSITLGGDVALAGALTTLGDFIQTGAHNVGFTTTGATTITLPVAGILAATTAAGTAGQVIIGATGATGEFASIAHAGGTITSTTGVNTLNLDTATSMIRTATVAVSSGEIKALAGSPKELIAAPGADKYIDFLGAVIALDFGSVAYDDAAADGNFQIRFDASTVVSLTVEADGLVDAVADAASTARTLATDVTMLANKKIELYNDGAEFTGAGGGDGVLKVIINYRILDLS